VLSSSPSYIFLSENIFTFDELTKCLVDIISIGSRSFKVAQSVLIGVVFDTLRLDLPHFSQIWFVAHQHNSNASIGIVLQLSQPFLHILKGLGLGDVKRNYSSNRTPIVSVSDRSKSLLACSIPNLVFYGFSVNVGCLGGKLNPDGWLRIHIEGVVNKSTQQIGLADPRISNHHDLEQEIKLLLPCHPW